MPEFFSFTLGAETNPRLPSTDETSPLLVGRFRAVVPATEVPIAAPVPKRQQRHYQRQQQQQQRPPFVASRSYWNAPASLLPSRSPSPFAAATGGRGRRSTASSFTGGGGDRGQQATTGHGFYNNTGYGAIAAAGYYDGIGDDDEEEEEEEDVAEYDDGYDEDDEDEDDDDDEDDEDDGDNSDLGNDSEYIDDGYIDDEPGGPSGTGTSVAAGQDGGNKGLGLGRDDETRRSRWSWLRLGVGRRRRSSGASDTHHRRRRSSTLAPSSAQRYRLSQRLRRQEHRQQLRQRQRQRQHRRIRGRIRRKIRRTYRTYRYCGRRAGRWLRRAVYRIGRHLRNLWLTPKNATVRRAVDRWWSRWTLLVVVPAVLAVAWCALPFPQYPLEGEDSIGGGGDDDRDGNGGGHRAPGHGEARVRIHFWFFLLAYYGPYNVTALIWITKVFNLYSLNWWPSSLGFPLSVSLLAAFSLAVPAALFTGVPAAEFLASHNTVWVTWTFAVMAMPVAAALVLLLLHERHRTLRHALSDTQRIFTSALWTGEADTLPRRWREQEQQKQKQKQQQRHLLQRNNLAAAPVANSRFRVGMFGRGGGGGESVAPAPDVDTLGFAFDQEHYLETSSLLSGGSTPPSVFGSSSYSTAASATTSAAAASAAARRGHWLPASFVRFLWLMSALFMSLLVYEMGEASASLFLAALPEIKHATVYTVAYVYGWIVTVFLLDAVTAWILGGRQGERVGSYPLGWVFKLYFMLTYQTYVRALYVRLRSPSQFVLLQVLSSTTLIVVSPLLMCSWTHRLLVAMGLNAQPYGAFQKVCVRNIFVRFVAENASMLAFLGSLFVLHFGPNRDVYPYFAFDQAALGGGGGGDGSSGGPGYTFSFTLYASSITWACELVAAFVVSGLIRYFYGLSVVGEGKMDLAVWPELLPTSVAVSVHVLQNMLFSIVRLQFW